ncbi:hypothetical protein ACTFIU_002530 [Dictyostelium citrinum]
MDDKNNYQMIGVDLTNVLPIACDESMMQSYSSGCILGAKTHYKTVKPNIICYMAEKPQTFYEYCQCTVEDFECDIGYENADSNFYPDSSTPEQVNCRVSLESSYFPTNEENCTPGETYYISKGFRKIAGSQCVGGVSEIYSPQMIMCPLNNSSVDDSRITGDNYFNSDENPSDSVLSHSTRTIGTSFALFALVLLSIFALEI